MERGIPRSRKPCDRPHRNGAAALALHALLALALFCAAQRGAQARSAAAAPGVAPAPAGSSAPVPRSAYRRRRAYALPGGHPGRARAGRHRAGHAGSL